MNTPPSRRPHFKLGQFVRRRQSGDAEPLIGTVVGILLIPFELAVVRWGATDTTIEPVEALVEVLKFFG
jgi:hypothetical protein